MGTKWPTSSNKKTPSTSSRPTPSSAITATFYQKYQSFYDALVPKKPFLLYAPTWQDSEQSTSYFDALPHLLALPETLTLVIKPHPHLPLVPIDRPNTRLLIDFPPIYPLLNNLDAYIGDMSSIGYDCLAFDKPMFFLNQNDRKGLYLFNCGVEIKKSQYAEIASLLQNHSQQPFPQKRKRPMPTHSDRSYLGRRPTTEVKWLYRSEKMCTQRTVCTRKD